MNKNIFENEEERVDFGTTKDFEIAKKHLLDNQKETMKKLWKNAWVKFEHGKSFQIGGYEEAFQIPYVLADEWYNETGNEEFNFEYEKFVAEPIEKVEPEVFCNLDKDLKNTLLSFTPYPEEWLQDREYVAVTFPAYYEYEDGRIAKMICYGLLYPAAVNDERGRFLYITGSVKKIENRVNE